MENNASPLEDKRTALAILLCLIVVMVYSEYVFAPYSRQAQQIQEAKQLDPVVNNPAEVGSPSTANTSTTTQNIPSPTRPTVNQLQQATKVTVKTELFTVVINSLGGRLQNFKLDRYKQVMDSPDSQEMVVVQDNQQLPMGVYAGNVSDESVTYSLIEVVGGREDRGIINIAGDDLAITLRGLLPNNTEITKTYKFRPNSYLFDVNIKLKPETADGSRIKLEWSQFESALHSANSFDFRGVTRLSNGSISKLDIASIEDGSESLGSDTWIEYGDKYFTAALIPAITGQNTLLSRNGQNISLQAYGTSDGGEFKLYLGPKEHNILRTVGYELHRSIDLGFFSVLAHPLLDILNFFFRVFGNYGLAIVLLTLLIKLAFLPLTKKSFKSMAAMQTLQPKIKALREKYSKDPNKMNQELIGLYKKEGINPMSGCFPILIQLPVFLGLYNALLNSIEMRHAPFALWIKDLSSPESLQLFGIGIPVMVILMGISMFVQQWTTPTAMDPTQKKIMMFMPIVLTFLFVNFPAGLVLYWLVNNIVSIIQQAFIRREKAAGATRATVVAGIAIFGFSYILTLI